jgi:hypothetical protein
MSVTADRAPVLTELGADVEVEAADTGAAITGTWACLPRVACLPEMAFEAVGFTAATFAATSFSATSFMTCFFFAPAVDLEGIRVSRDCKRKTEW